MITRAQMPRQLRDKGGIASVTPRKKYGLGSKIKDRFRKLIPNELASIAVTAAPFVAPFNPGIAAIMRGVGRFDQRGSISDALKQGLGTFAFGKGVRALGGAPAQEGFFGTPGDRFTSPLSQDRTTAVKDFFKSDATRFEKKAGGKEAKEGIKIVSEAAEKAFEGIPIVRDLPDTVKQKLLVGGVTAGATGVYEYFQGKFRPPEPGETMEEYLAARKERVGIQMRSLFDNYFKSDPEYSVLDDAGRDAFIARYNLKDGGRANYQTGGVTMANTLAENIRRNLANQAAINQRLQQARARLDEIRPGRIASQSQLQQEANKIAAEDLNRMTGGARGIAANITGAPTMSDIQAAIAANRNVNRIQTGPRPGELDPLGLPMSMTMLGPLPESGPQSLAEIEATRKRIEAAQAAMKPTYEEALMGESWETLSDGDQYRLAMEYPGETPPRRNPDFVPSLAKGGMPTGIMRTNKAGVMERDYRDEGGFVPVGIKEKADDVPAMLSKNEFVFTADAVRGAGNGSIEKGAQRMYDTMKNLEKRVT